MMEPCQTPSNVLDTDNFEANEMERPLLSTLSLLDLCHNLEDEKSALDAVRKFRRRNAKQRRKFNVDENINDDDDKWNTCTFFTIIKNSRLKACFVACISAVSIVFWIWVAIVQQSVVIFISAAVGCLTSATTLIFEQKVLYTTRKADQVILPEETFLRRDILKLQNENELISERVENLRLDVHSQECVLRDLDEMKCETSKRKDLLSQENRQLLKNIRRCEAQDKVIDELICVLQRKLVRADCEEKDQKYERSLKQSVYAEIQSRMDGKREFDVNEIKNIINVNQIHHNCRKRFNLIKMKETIGVKNDTLQTSPDRFISHSNSTTPGSSLFF